MQDNNGSDKIVNSQPFGAQSVVTSSSEARPIVNKAAQKPLSREQILIFVSVGLGILALIFLVMTIALAVNQNGSVKDERIVAPSVSSSQLGFATNKIENAASGAAYRLALSARDNSGNNVVNIRVGSDSQNLTMEVNWEFVSQYYGISVARNDNETFTIDFGRNIADVTFGYATNLSSDAVLLVLLDDGSVAYMPMAKALQGRNIKNYGKLEDLSEIVKFYQADLTESYETSATTLAQDVNGGIVDLRSRLLAIIGKDSQ